MLVASATFSGTLKPVGVAVIWFPVVLRHGYWDDKTCKHGRIVKSVGARSCDDAESKGDNAIYKPAVATLELRPSDPSLSVPQARPRAALLLVASQPPVQGLPPQKRYELVKRE